MKKGTISVLATILGAAVGATAVGTISGKTIDEKATKVEKFKNYYNMLNQWLVLKQEGKNLSSFFESNEYKTIAIYGMGEMGNRLYDELKNTNIEIKYAIDKNADSTYTELEVIDPEDSYEDVDAIVVTATFAFEDIESKVSSKTECPVISLEDVVYEI